ncbi:unnamed protein product [Amoebophrya sp. A120]|nr:unnamed protein product [Amoebophrya sp. A120]|eukprot:GSA120T00018659001.1
MLGSLPCDCVSIFRPVLLAVSLLLVFLLQTTIGPVSAENTAAPVHHPRRPGALLRTELRNVEADPPGSQEATTDSATTTEVSSVSDEGEELQDALRPEMKSKLAPTATKARVETRIRPEKKGKLQAAFSRESKTRKRGARKGKTGAKSRVSATHTHSDTVLVKHTRASSSSSTGTSALSQTKRRGHGTKKPLRHEISAQQHRGEKAKAKGKGDENSSAEERTAVKAEGASTSRSHAAVVGAVLSEQGDVVAHGRRKHKKRPAQHHRSHGAGEALLGDSHADEPVIKRLGVEPRQDHRKHGKRRKPQPGQRQTAPAFKQEMNVDGDVAEAEASATDEIFDETLENRPTVPDASANSEVSPDRGAIDRYPKDQYVAASVPQGKGAEDTSTGNLPHYDKVAAVSREEDINPGAVGTTPLTQPPHLPLPAGLDSLIANLVQQTRNNAPQNYLPQQAAQANAPSRMQNEKQVFFRGGGPAAAAPPQDFSGAISRLAQEVSSHILATTGVKDHSKGLQEGGASSAANWVSSLLAASAATSKSANNNSTTSFTDALQNLIAQEVTRQVHAQQSSSSAQVDLEKALQNLISGAISQTLGGTQTGGGGFGTAGQPYNYNSLYPGFLTGGFNPYYGFYSPTGVATGQQASINASSGGGASGGGQSQGGVAVPGGGQQHQSAGGGTAASGQATVTTGRSNDPPSPGIQLRAHIFHCGKKPAGCYSLDSQSLVQLGHGVKQVCPGFRSQYTNGLRYPLLAASPGACRVDEGDPADAAEFRGWMVRSAEENEMKHGAASSSTSFLETRTNVEGTTTGSVSQNNRAAGGKMLNSMPQNFFHASDCSLSSNLFSRDLVYDTQDQRLLPPRGAVGLSSGVITDGRAAPQAMRYEFELKPRRLKSTTGLLLYKIRLHCRNGATVGCGKYLCVEQQEVLPCLSGKASQADWFAVIPGPVHFAPAHQQKPYSFAARGGAVRGPQHISRALHRREQEDGVALGERDIASREQDSSSAQDEAAARNSRSHRKSRVETTRRGDARASPAVADDAFRLQSSASQWRGGGDVIVNEDANAFPASYPYKQRAHARNGDNVGTAEALDDVSDFYDDEEEETSPEVVAGAATSFLEVSSLATRHQRATQSHASSVARSKSLQQQETRHQQQAVSATGHSVNPYSQCFDDLERLIFGCACHRSCSQCGWSRNPTRPDNCISCVAPGANVRPVYIDGAGVCPDVMPLPAPPPHANFGPRDHSAFPIRSPNYQDPYGVNVRDQNQYFAYLRAQQNARDAYTDQHLRADGNSQALRDWEIAQWANTDPRAAGFRNKPPPGYHFYQDSGTSIGPPAPCKNSHGGYYYSPHRPSTDYHYIYHMRNGDPYLPFVPTVAAGSTSSGGSSTTGGNSTQNTTTTWTAGGGAGGFPISIKVHTSVKTDDGNSGGNANIIGPIAAGSGGSWNNPGSPGGGSGTGWPVYSFWPGTGAGSWGSGGGGGSFGGAGGSGSSGSPSSVSSGSTAATKTPSGQPASTGQQSTPNTAPASFFKPYGSHSCTGTNTSSAAVVHTTSALDVCAQFCITNNDCRGFQVIVPSGQGLNVTGNNSNTSGNSSSGVVNQTTVLQNNASTTPSLLSNAIVDCEIFFAPVAPSLTNDSASTCFVRLQQVTPRYVALPPTARSVFDLILDPEKREFCQNNVPLAKENSDGSFKYVPPPAITAATATRSQRGTGKNHSGDKNSKHTQDDRVEHAATNNGASSSAPGAVSEMESSKLGYGPFKMSLSLSIPGQTDYWQIVGATEFYRAMEEGVHAILLEHDSNVTLHAVDVTDVLPVQPILLETSTTGKKQALLVAERNVTTSGNVHAKRASVDAEQGITTEGTPAASSSAVEVQKSAEHVANSFRMEISCVVHFNSTNTNLVDAKQVPYEYVGEDSTKNRHLLDIAFEDWSLSYAVLHIAGMSCEGSDCDLHEAKPASKKEEEEPSTLPWLWILFSLALLGAAVSGGYWYFYVHREGSANTGADDGTPATGGEGAAAEAGQEGVDSDEGQGEQQRNAPLERDADAESVASKEAPSGTGEARSDEENEF